MKRKLGIAAACVAAFVLFVFLNNTSMLAPHRSGRPVLLAHRGVSQTFSHAGLDIFTGCTATRIYPPKHAYLENTIASMEKSFALGADIIELDIQPTTDGQFAVFHDWAVDCRTDGHGTTREHSMKYLKTLDIGYGYTADGGKTYPFRGKFVGQMPSLDEVVARFPGKRILINVKSDEPDEGGMLSIWLSRQTPAERRALMVYGSGPRPLDIVRARVPDVPVMSAPQLKRCLLTYLAVGWSGYVPARLPAHGDRGATELCGAAVGLAGQIPGADGGGEFAGVRDGALWWRRRRRGEHRRSTRRAAQGLFRRHLDRGNRNRRATSRAEAIVSPSSSGPSGRAHCRPDR